MLVQFFRPRAGIVVNLYWGTVHLKIFEKLFPLRTVVRVIWTGFRSPISFRLEDYAFF